MHGEVLLHPQLAMTLRKFGAASATTLVLASGGILGADQAQNPYDDKGTHYELPIKSDIPQGERVEIAKDKAAMTLKPAPTLATQSTVLDSSPSPYRIYGDTLHIALRSLQASSNTYG